jgi:hypothetical protein
MRSDWAFRAAVDIFDPGGRPRCLGCACFAIWVGGHGAGRRRARDAPGLVSLGLRGREQRGAR